MDFNTFYNSSIAFFNNESWILQVFIIVFLALFLNWFQKRLLKQLLKKLEQTRTYWDDALVDAMRRPLSFLIWVIGLTFAAEIVKEESQAVIFGAVEPIREVGVIVAITWFLVRFVERAEKNIIRKKRQAGVPFDMTTADAIAKLLRISVIITAFLVTLQTLGYSITGVLAFGGVGGIAPLRMLSGLINQF